MADVPVALRLPDSSDLTAGPVDKTGLDAGLPDARRSRRQGGNFPLRSFF
jgi:hypothetical protein